MSDIKQLRLLSGEEILCDVVDIQYDEESESETFVMRAAYTLVSQEDFENGYRYYTFRPFMMHINDPSHILILNSHAIICLTNPSKTVVDQYIKHMELFRKEERERLGEKGEDFLTKLAEMDEALADIDDENVVTLRPKPKLH